MNQLEAPFHMENDDQLTISRWTKYFWISLVAFIVVFIGSIVFLYYFIF